MQIWWISWLRVNIIILNERKKSFKEISTLRLPNKKPILMSEFMLPIKRNSEGRDRLNTHSDASIDITQTVNLTLTYLDFFSGFIYKSNSSLCWRRGGRIEGENHSFIFKLPSIKARKESQISEDSDVDCWLIKSDKNKLDDSNVNTDSSYLK